MRLRLLTESPDAYLLRAAAQTGAERQRDSDTIRDAITRLSRGNESMREAGVGLGWTAEKLCDILSSIEELDDAASAPYGIKWWPREDFDPCSPTVTSESIADGSGSSMCIRFDSSVPITKLIRIDEFVALFPSITAIDTAAVEGVSAGMTPTHSCDFAEWWKAGHGPPSLRQFLAPYAIGDAVVAEGAPSSEPGEFEWYEVHCVDSDRFQFSRHAVLSEAIRDAIARVKDGVRTQLLGFHGGRMGVGRTMSFFSMNTEESHAVEAVLARAVEAVQMPRVGHLVEGENDFEVVVIEAGMSMNRNYYPASLLKKKFVEVFEGAPVRVIGWDPQRYTGETLPDSADHIPFEIAKQLPAGTILNQVGQLVDLRFEATGGTAPDPTEARVLAKRFGMTTEEIMEEAVGTVMGRLSMDSDQRSQAMATKLHDAAERGTLQKFGLSIDVDEAPYVAVWETWMSSPINWRTDINGSKGVYLDFVNRPSARGRVLARDAA